MISVPPTSFETSRTAFQRMTWSSYSSPYYPACPATRWARWTSGASSPDPRGRCFGWRHPEGTLCGHRYPCWCHRQRVTGGRVIYCLVPCWETETRLEKTQNDQLKIIHGKQYSVLSDCCSYGRHFTKLFSGPNFNKVLSKKLEDKHCNLNESNPSFTELLKQFLAKKEKDNSLKWHLT